MDFRGRAYPMPPHLNHLGNDLCRGLLHFANGKPLGPFGMNWLKIQIASLMGHDKKPFEDRIKFVDRHLGEVNDSAENPFDGRRWWLTADDPWQCLAACFELAEALKSPNPDDFISYIPIHQDGTCNGLQHYAALGGDISGARQVNMLPADGPQDLYTAVSSAVQKLVNEDFKKDVPEAILMKNRVNRKLVKQTVMTNTYGVTFIGARRQVTNRLKEARVSDPTPLSDDEIQKCGFYITKLIFHSMGEMFSGAKNTQLWLNKAAKMISMSVDDQQLSEKELAVTQLLIKSGLIKSAEEVKIERAPKSDSLIDSATLDRDESDFEILEPDDYSPTSVVPATLEKKIVSRMQSVTWTTPIGLPIVQPYRFFKTQDVSIF
jgi:DNA-directed RNA polymerase